MPDRPLTFSTTYLVLYNLGTLLLTSGNTLLTSTLYRISTLYRLFAVLRERFASSVVRRQLLRLDYRRPLARSPS